MALPGNRMLSLAACCCILCACGARPDLPGSTQPDQDSAGAAVNSDAEDETAVLGARPDEPAPSDSVDPEPADAGESAPAPPVADADEAPAAPTGGALAACTEDGGNCLVINVAVSDRTNQSCIQLAIDDCGIYGRGQLRVDLPVAWRMSSASVGKLNGDCTPAAEFDPDSAIILKANGAISWNQETPQPSDLVLDVTLEPPAEALDPAPTNVAGQLAGVVPECVDDL
jgi:hypothetical protein